MACDFMPRDNSNNEYVRSFTVTVDGELSRKLRRPQGKYCTVECRAVRERNAVRFGEISSLLKDAIVRPAPIKRAACSLWGWAIPT